MSEYIKFWVAQYLVDIVGAVVVVAGLLIAALWSMRGQKFYKEPKK